MNVVTEEALNVALITYHRTRPHEGAIVAMRSALAAVAPIIVKQERERCARVADDKATEMYATAASARDEGDQERCERMTYRGNGAKSAAAAPPPALP